MYLFLRGEVVHNVEQLSDFLRSLALDHVCNGFAPDIPESGLVGMKWSHETLTRGT